MLNEMMQRDAKSKFIPFKITFVSCNLKQNTGGEKITFDKAVFVGGPSDRVTERNPNHFGNHTRNIKSVGGDRIITIHPLLVTHFNGKQIAQ